MLFFEEIFGPVMPICTYDTIDEAIAYVNAHYSDTEKGIFTDRGRIYVRYGEPDDMTVEVMPMGTSSLDWVIEEEV